MNTAQVKKKLADILAYEDRTLKYFVSNKLSAYRVIIEFDVKVGKNKWTEKLCTATNRPNQLYRQLAKIKAVSDITIQIV